jgi:hypothetical protein
VENLATKIAIVLWYLKRNSPQRRKFAAMEIHRLLGSIPGQILLAARHANFRVEQSGKKVMFVPLGLEKNENKMLDQLGIRTRLVQRRGRADLEPLELQRGGTRLPRISYYVEASDESFSQAVAAILQDKRGLGARAHYVAVDNRDDAQIIVRLTPQAKINKRCKLSKLSCSVISFDASKPDEILISLENWLGQSQYPGPLADYRTYIINHEFLHCRPFYLDHPDAAEIAIYCAESRPVPVMYQQSNGLPPQCRLNSWPLARDFRRTFRPPLF